MYSNDQNHIREYEYWADISGKKVTVSTGNGTKDFTVPTFSENLKFFFRYQTGFMYWRYFMWNFAGRQNDIQGNGNILHGNWISGIPFIDDHRLGDQDSLPDALKNNPGTEQVLFPSIDIRAWQVCSGNSKEARKACGLLEHCLL